MAMTRYEFRVSGRLSERTAQAFDDMDVTPVPPETIISGEVIDQSHLHGLLNRFQDLGLRVVEMHELPD